MTDPIVGIDLGTSNTVVAYADSMGNTTVLADDAGYKIHPSVVSFHPSGGVVVGAAAKQRKVIDPANTVFSAKRLIGRRYQSNEVQIAMKRMPYEIIEGENHLPKIVTRAGEFAVPEVSAIVLDHVKEVATQRLQQDVSRAVITVPASFNDAQRSATANAGAVAGLTVMRVLNEPTAAALAYGNSRNLRQTIAVYDFGGGTFDVTILKLDNEVYEVLGTAGDNFLGGDDLDEKLVDRMCVKFLKDTRIDLKNNEISMMRLRAVAEQTKIELSRRSRAVVRIDEIAYGPKGAPLNLQIEITRDEFVGEISPLIDRTFPVCQEAMILSGLDISKVDDVILVGGTTKIPYVRDMVTRFFNKTPRTDIAPEEAVAVGAALQATALDRILTKSGRISAQSAIAPQNKISNQFPVEMSESTFTGVMEPPKEVTRTAVGAEIPGRVETTETGIGELPRAPAAQLPISPPQARTMVADLEGNAPRGEVQQPVERRSSPATGARGLSRPAAVNVRTAPSTSAPPTKTDKEIPTMDVDPEPSKKLVLESRNVQQARNSRPSIPAPLAPPPFVPPVQPPPIPPQQARPSAPPPFVPPPVQPPSPSAQPFVAPPPPPPSAPYQAQQAPQSGSYPQQIPIAQAPTIAAMPVPQYVPPAPQPPPPEPEPPRPAPVVLDVTPRGLGIGTVAGFCEELIRRNARIPAQMRKTFTTIRDNQDLVQIVVCQGESKRLDNNIVLGDLRLENIPQRPRGETSIEVTFELDASGILNVRAKDTLTGKQQQVSLDVVGTLPEEDIAAARNRLKSLTR